MLKKLYNFKFKVINKLEQREFKKERKYLNTLTIKKEIYKD